MKLFGMRSVDKTALAQPPEEKYTRYVHRHNRAPVQYVPEPVVQPCQTGHVTPQRPAPRVVATAAEQELSLADQLHSEAQISTALLRRALPQRFADIDAQTQKHAQEDLGELQASFR